MKKLFGRLHKSKSVSEETRHKITNCTEEENKPSTSNRGICHLAPSKTFDVLRYFFDMFQK